MDKITHINKNFKITSHKIRESLERKRMGETAVVTKYAEQRMLDLRGVSYSGLQFHIRKETFTSEVKWPC